MRNIWLASYPRSGNTWTRMLIEAALLPEGAALDINALRRLEPIASNLKAFEEQTLLDCGVLTFDEIDRLRPLVHAAMARERSERHPDGARFVKVHDAYTRDAAGRPLLAGRNGADAAILIVRDPRDVAPSLADFLGGTVNSAIAFMASAEASLSADRRQANSQLRQRLLSWSGHAASWLEQDDIPVRVVRYEDLHDDAERTLRDALDFVGSKVDAARISRAVTLASFAEMRRQEDAHGFRENPGGAGRRAFFRRGVAGAWRNDLTPAQIDRIHRAHGAMMARLGYAPTTREE
jgi:plasmid stabilization system protein ParE